MPKKSTNTFSRGLQLSTDPINQSKDTYSYALNAVKENIINNPETLSNEKGFVQYLNLGYQYVLLGTRYLGKKDYVYFIMNNEGATTFNRILLVQDGVVTKTIRDNLDLNFNTSHPIISTYRLNYKNQRIVYFVDGLNDDRVVNIDIDSTAYDITLFSVNSTANKPIIEATVLDTGGSLQAGQYFIAISYNLGDSYTTEPLIVSKAISIAGEDYYNNVAVTDTITRLYGQTDGDIIPNPTRKSIEITTTDVDTNFDSYNIIVLRQTETANFVRVVKNIAPQQSVFTYTGLEGDLDDTLTLNDIITSSVNYYASEAIIQKDNRLLRANSKLRASNFNYQAFANNIVVRYKINEELIHNVDVQNGYFTSSESDGGYIDIANVIQTHGVSPSYLANTANNDPDNKTFMRDEVYSLGIGFELIDGTETDVFHIPGRLPNYFSTVPTGVGEYNRAYTPTWDTDIVEGQPRWKVRNTAIKQAVGELAYWQSSDVYQDNYGYPTNGDKNLDNKSYIRHHKMPSDILEPIYRTEVIGDPNLNRGELINYKLYRRNLGLDFSNIVIPVDLQGLVKKVKFFYTPRDSSNKSILSKGITYKLLKNSDNQLEQSRYFNYEMTATDAVTQFEFISPEVNFNFKQANLSGAKIKVCGIDKGYVNYAGAKQNIDLNGPYYIRTFNNALFEETGRRQAIVNPFCFYNQRAIPREDNYSRDINKLLYVDANYVGSSDVGNLKFADSNNTSILEVVQPLRLKPTTYTSPISAYYPELLYSTGVTQSSRLYRNLYLNYPIALDTGNVWNGYEDGVDWIEERSWATESYYDTAYYVSVVSNKSNLYGAINNLKFAEVGTPLVYTTGNILSATVNGGDTVIDLHHFKQTKTTLVARQPGDPVNVPVSINVEGGFNNRYAGQTDNLITEVLEVGTQSFGSFVCETDINIRMRREGTTDDEKYFPKSYYNTVNLKNISKYFDNKEFYKIDAPYNNQYLKPYFIAYTDIATLTNTANEDIRYYTRIIYSDKQNLEDKTDNYRKTRANNYRDLPLDKGGISILFIKNEKLYAITRDTVFNVYTSNQSLQSLNETNITVGTGEFLGVEPIDLLNIDGGFAGTTSKLSFAESPYGYLFVDRYKGKIILFDGDLDDIAIKDINDFYQDNFNIKAIDTLDIPDGEFDNPLNNYGYICGFDAELNRFLITKLDYGLTITDDPRYKGIFDPNIDYQDGDIYLKDGKLLYVFSSSTQQDVDLVPTTTNLSDFIQSDIDPISFTHTSPAHGTLVDGDGIITYTPTTNYVGTDTFNITSNCKTGVVNITIEETQFPFKWIIDDSASYCEPSQPQAFKWVINDNASYCEQGGIID